MDAVEYLTGQRVKMHEVYTAEISISFCGPARPLTEKLMKSLESISLIATEIGFPFEIILVADPGDRELWETLQKNQGRFGNFYVLKQGTRNYGEAVRVGFEASSNKFFIPFDTSLVYDVRYADIIHSFLMKREKKLFLTELPVIHRDLINDVGGYRDLAYSHDIDLYSRIAMMYGVVAFPAMFNRIPIISPPPRNEGGLGNEERPTLKKMRDHIIACNYDVDDLMALYESTGKGGRLRKKILFSILFLVSRISRIKPFRFDRNNYLVLMENIFESLVLKDFARYGLEETEANMVLSSEEVNYLRNRSRLYKDVIYSINKYVVEL